MEEKLGFKELVCKKAATQVRRVGLEEGTGEKSQGWAGHRGERCLDRELRSEVVDG